MAKCNQFTPLSFKGLNLNGQVNARIAYQRTVKLQYIVVIIRPVVEYSITEVVGLFESSWNYSSISNHSKCNNAHRFAEE